MDMNIGHNFRKIRKNLGLDILDVSIETGYSELHLVQLERDKRRPSFDCIMDLIDYYGYEPNELFDVDGRESFTDGQSVSYEDRLKKLTVRDRHKATKTIEAVLQVFEEVD